MVAGATAAATVIVAAEPIVAGAYIAAAAMSVEVFREAVSMVEATGAAGGKDRRPKRKDSTAQILAVESDPFRIA
jgi:hypothetical protein